MNHTYEILFALGVLSPMISFWLLVFFGPKMGKPGAGWVGVILGMGVPLVFATIVLIGWWGEDPVSRAALAEHAYRFHWANLGTVPVTVGVKLDSLTVAMYFMVAFVAFWIFVFSLGYMSGHSDEVDGQCKYSRFFAYLSLFGFSMLGLVVSSSLVFLFIFWELVGLCSYLLIGFYFDRAYASAAAVKAFITNRFGDFGFIIGLMLVFFQLKTLDLDEAAAIFAQQYAAHTGIFASHFTMFGWSLATIMGIGLFCGAMGKSAQFPLHVWLPDAMAGPTPVSALIHAATMVAAGVYLVARVFRLMTPEALMFIAAIGCLTLTLMALVAIVQTDIKKCLAYSTLSQLGYMIFGMGCGAWIAALFHLITHAFFKAMLFLCSGQVIEGCHHEQEMPKMGGLRKKMPVTCWTFFIGVLAISGAGIAGTKIGLGGFFSKDEILAVAYARSFEWDDYDKHEEGHAGNGGHAAAPGRPAETVRLASFRDPAPVQKRSKDYPPLEIESTDERIRYGGKILHGGAIQTGEDGWRSLWRYGSVVLFSVDDWTDRPDDIDTVLRLIPEERRSHAKVVSADVFLDVQSTFWDSTDDRSIVVIAGDSKCSWAEVLEAIPADRRSHVILLPQHEVEGADRDHRTGNGAHADSHGPVGRASIFAEIPPLPKWMFYLAIFTAYVTPFYMMRAWWMTFMGKPRDEQVYRHAHEIPLMYVPLIVLAVGTFVSSYFIFRPLMSDASAAATDAAMILATDGHTHTAAIGAAHGWLKLGVGGAFIVGFAIAIAIYGRGLATAEAIKRAVGPLYVILVRKYFFDEVYNFVLVQGGILVSQIARLIDTYVVDLIFDLMAATTARLAFFSGLIIDNEGVDGVVNGIAKSSKDLGNVMRQPQTGRIRNYVLFATAVATIVIICVLVYGSESDQATKVAQTMIP